MQHMYMYMHATFIYSHTHTHTHSLTPFSRWEPCCIPLQFKNCCHRRADDNESKSSCCCVACIPIRPSTCIIRGTDSVPDDQQIQPLSQATGNITEDDPHYKYMNIYTCTHLHTHTHTHTHMHTRTYTSIHTLTHTHTHPLQVYKESLGMHLLSAY